MMSWDGRIRGDARALPLANECVQCVVTSPPYWGLRDYKDADQIGLEATPAEYIEALLGVFREVWRCLKPDGTLWLNIGDCFATGAGSGRSMGGKVFGKQNEIIDAGSFPKCQPNRMPIAGLKPKDLVGMPWRLAFALQAYGWYLRRDIIWHKPNPMPESVTDRPTSAHEYIFLLTKSERYFYDHEAIKEPGSVASAARLLRAQSGYAPPGQTPHHGNALGPRENRTDKQRGHGRRHEGFNDRWDAMKKEQQCAEPRNKRSVWTIATRPYTEAHYATFPEEIPEICIKAGSRPGDLILDPFMGSGTVARVAERLSRRWIGIDLNYQDLQLKRLRNVQKELTEVFQ